MTKIRSSRSRVVKAERRADMTKVIIALRYLREGASEKVEIPFSKELENTGGADIYPYPLLTSGLEGGKRSISRLGRFRPRKENRHQLSRGNN